jgi:hypothetical protein
VALWHRQTPKTLISEFIRSRRKSKNELTGETFYTRTKYLDSTMLYHPSVMWLMAALLALVMLPTTTMAEQEDHHFFYMDSEAVREYFAEDQVEENLFMNERGPKVVEFYSPLCVSTVVHFDGDMRL